MARPYNQKRHRADEPSHQDDPTNGRKRQRTDESSHQDNHPTKEPSWQYPPEFWDRLSKIPLIHSAVEELEKRTYTRPSRPSPPTELAQNSSGSGCKELARFAGRTSGISIWSWLALTVDHEVRLRDKGDAEWTWNGRGHDDPPAYVTLGRDGQADNCSQSFVLPTQ
ncbi:hypothetical protein B0T10DRAFT_494894 [Thelonectria olida]|uniref:Uncharacterized protein n=1 Tax=Thelonectria olida TaxID=1576542 RepID=A0A9P8VW32_9HYPO|nr:hypothetical protein B0T10DRAFT_494894 [Thelonectria olida]